MLRTKLTELVGIEHPIVLGGMASGTSVDLVAAVSQAGGLVGRISAEAEALLRERVPGLLTTPAGERR